MSKLYFELEKDLSELEDKLTLTYLDIQEVPTSSLVSILIRVLNEITKDYSLYRKYIPTLLRILEKSRSASVPVLVESFFSLFDELLTIQKFKENDDLLWQIEYNENTINDKLKDLLDRFRSNGSKFRVLSLDLDKSSLSSLEKRELVSFMIDCIHDAVKKLTWDSDNVHNALLQLGITRSLLIDLDEIDLLYFLAAMVLDRFSTSEYYQQARDFSEELVSTSYVDDCPYLGYFNSFKCYSNNNSAVPALLYALLSMTSALKNPSSINEKYVKEFISTGIKYFRNINQNHLVEYIFESLPKNVTFSPYEKRSLTHSYFVSLLLKPDKRLPSMVLDFLRENREEILQTGEYDALPWLITLYNIRKVFPDSDFSQTGLGYYITLFEMVVPSESYSSYKAINEGDIEKLKPLLRNSLVKLNSTRSRDDVVNDNDMAIKIASSMISQGIIKKDREALLLAMMIRSDFSFVFMEREIGEETPIDIPEVSLESFEKIYGSETSFIKKLSSEKGVSFLWIISTETQCFQFGFSNGEFYYDVIQGWDQGKFNSLITAGYFSKFNFDDTVKTSSQIKVVLPEEHLAQSEEYKSEFSFFRITPISNQTFLYVVMDMDLAGFPHNLLLDKENELIHLSYPIANILSTEWYIKYSNQTVLSKAFTKSIWLPIEGGDFVLNLLYSKLEETIKLNYFNLVTTVEPKMPINSELNIICAHGANDIALKQVVFPDSTPRLNLDKYLSSGKLLIFFVCHSGSISSTPFENSISSIVKSYITKGYSAVIAPYWALHVNIPPLWLPEFIKSICQGLPVVEAVYNANMAVHKIYPTLAAWCCLHLYGDPQVKLEL